MGITAAMVAVALQAVAPEASDAPQYRGQGQMRIFDMLCNRVFPDDARIATAMEKTPGAHPLAKDHLRAFLGKDPGRGWIISAGTSNLVVTIETAPGHACAVRMTNTDGVIDEGVWAGLIADAQARSGGGFTVVPPSSFTIGEAQSRVSGVQKESASGAVEAFYLIRTSWPSPPARPGAGIEIRMVHQLFERPGR